MKPDKKKIETSRAPRWALGPPFVASLLSPALGPSGVPEKFQFIFLSGFMKPPKVSIFAPKNIRETPETIKKINETRSQKKMRGFLLKPRKPLSPQGKCASTPDRVHLTVFHCICT